MDELFGGVDLTNVEDIGTAARNAKALDEEDADETEAVRASNKV
jgi:hypothetical protein